MSSNLCLIAASLVTNGQAPGWQLAVPPSSIANSSASQPSPQAISSQPLCPSPANFVQAKAVPSTNQTDDRLAIAQAEFSDRHHDAHAVLNQLGITEVGPMTSRQLFFQRVAALRAGSIYTRLATDSFRQEWANATQNPTYQQWLKLLAQEAKMVTAGQGNNRLTVLVGDSHALWFPTKYLSKEQYWLNQGISGDTTKTVLDRLDLFKATRPDTIHVMVGINDIRQGKTDEEILTNLRLIMRQLRRNHPQAQVFIHSILPTRLEAIPSSRIRWLNYNISSYSKREKVTFLNLQPAFADATGQLRRTFTTDGIHLNDRGYAMWQVTAAPIL